MNADQNTETDERLPDIVGLLARMATPETPRKSLEFARAAYRAEVDRAGNHRFQLLRYTREGDGKYELMQSTTDITRLKQAVNDIGSYVNEVMNLFERMYRGKS
jgi:hypothetical protein